MKKELLWTLPVAGLACWILGFPFMKRYSKNYLKKHPEKAGKDLEITKKACEKFKNQPITIVNFIEGTRFTPQKRERQASPYKHLLKPKAGGFAFVLSAMSGHLNHIVNTTIIYPPETNLWRFMCGKTKKIIVRYEVTPVPPELIGDYFHNKEFRIRLQRWLNQFWHEKDQLIENTLQKEKASLSK
jgi:1-acyl-sn-glycerol-3-phosphate acyltransferase